MKKIIYFFIAAAMTLSIASCNRNIQTEQNPLEDSITYMQWQQIDSVTSHINLDELSCITMTVEDTVIVFETQGIESFSIVSDTVELPVSKDSNTYYLSVLDIEAVPAVIQEDSVAVRRLILNSNVQGCPDTIMVPVKVKEF